MDSLGITTTQMAEERLLVDKGTVSRHLSGDTAMNITQLEAITQVIKTPAWRLLLDAQDGYGKLLEVLPAITAFHRRQKPAMNSTELILFAFYCLRHFAGTPINSRLLPDIYKAGLWRNGTAQ